MSIKVDNRTRFKKIVLIDTLLENASEIVSDMKRRKNKQDDKQEIELLSLLFQIISLAISISPAYCLEHFSGINSNLPIKKAFTELGAEIIQLDRRQFEWDRRKLRTYIADDRRTGYLDRRKIKAG